VWRSEAIERAASYDKRTLSAWVERLLEEAVKQPSQPVTPVFVFDRDGKEIGKFKPPRKLARAVTSGSIVLISRRSYPRRVPRRGGVMTFPDLDGQRRERLREAIELSVRTLNEWDQARLGISQEQLAALTAWAKIRPGEEGVTALRAKAAARKRAAKEHA
jgi:hypothetical protein